MNAERYERLVVNLAREIGDGDTVVVGVGTPLALAAVLLARELGRRITVLLPGASDPVYRNVADYLTRPWSAGTGAARRMSRMDILGALRAGRVDLQFIRPAQVDARLWVNTELVITPRGEPRHLAGPVALPDVAHLVHRIVAYLPAHDPRTLVAEVTTVTAPRPGSPPPARVITPLATLEPGPATARVVARRPDVADDELARCTGFPIALDGAAATPEPTATELDLLRTVVDPLALAAIEDPVGRPAALGRLADRWAAEKVAP